MFESKGKRLAVGGIMGAIATAAVVFDGNEGPANGERTLAPLGKRETGELATMYAGNKRTLELLDQTAALFDKQIAMNRELMAQNGKWIAQNDEWIAQTGVKIATLGVRPVLGALDTPTVMRTEGFVLHCYPQADAQAGGHGRGFIEIFPKAPEGCYAKVSFGGELLSGDSITAIKALNELRVRGL